MATPQLAVAFNDFSLGEVDATIKRSEGPAAMTGGRQMANFRILNTHKLANRPGRSPLFFESARVEEILMAPGQKFYLAFGNGYLRVYNAAGTRVFNSTLKGDGSTLISWTTATPITYAIPSIAEQFVVYIFYADGTTSNVPQILTWDGVSQSSSWVLSTFAETVTVGGQKRTPFYRIAPQNISMLPSDVNGNISITFSDNVLTAGMVGTRMRFCERQIQITGVSNGKNGTATVIETLPASQTLTFSSIVGTLNIGDEVAGSNSGARAIVTNTATSQSIVVTGPLAPAIGDTVTGATSGASGTILSVTFGFQITLLVGLSGATPFQAAETINDTTSSSSGTIQSVSAKAYSVQLLPNPDNTPVGFNNPETVVGPAGFGTTNGVSTTVPKAVAIWDQEVMNNFRGWPVSGFFDQNRLGLCNFPSVPSGIAWSAIGLPTDLYPGAIAAEAIFELAPGKSIPYYVVPGMEGSEFVLCDNAIYYIPINVNNPLKPGSVIFNELSGFGTAPNVQPRRAEQTIIFLKAGGIEVGAIQAPGAYYRPYIVDHISEMHSHLFTASAVTALAVPAATSQFEELYIYIALANGSLVVGKYTMHNGLIEPGQDGKPKVGWTPWSGTGTTLWCAALGGDVIFTANYQITGAPSFTAVEKSDATQYLDCALAVNNLPAAIAAARPGGKGPLWFIAGGSAFLIDNGTRFMGTYQVDGNGWIVPQNQGGENLNSANLIAGQMWTATYEPFVPHAPSGESHHQRMKRRRVTRAVASVQNSSGFVLDTRRIPPYFEGEDATQPAPLREDSYRTRPRGWVFDPRVALVKDTPGPLTLLELGLEATI